MTLPDLDPSDIGHIAFYQASSSKTNLVSELKQYISSYGTYEEYSNGVDGVIQLGSGDLVYKVRVRVKDDGYIITYLPDTELFKEYSNGEEGIGTWTISVPNLRTDDYIGTDVGTPTSTHSGTLFGAIKILLNKAYSESLSFSDGVGYYSYSYPDATNLSIFSDSGMDNKVSFSYTSGVDVEIHTIFEGGTSFSELTVDGEKIRDMQKNEAYKIPAEYGGGTTITESPTSTSDIDVGITSLWK